MPLDDAEARRLLMGRLRPALRRKGLTEGELTDELNLIDSGLLDSLAMLQLIADIEEQLQAHFDLFDVHPDRLTTIGGLLELIASTDASPSSPRSIHHE